MKPILQLAGLFSLIVLAGCRDESEVSAGDPATPGAAPAETTGTPPIAQPGTTQLPKADPSMVEGITNRARGAWESLKTEVAQADESLAELRADLQPKLDQASEATRTQWLKIQESLGKTRAEVEEKLAAVGEASGEKLEQAKQAYQDAYARLKAQIAEARQQLDDKE